MSMKLARKETIIIISGGPGTGKSRTAESLKKLLKEDKIISLSYDDMKEAAWDDKGFDNEAEKKERNNEALLAFYDKIGEHMGKGDTLMIEYPFYQYHKGPLEELVERFNYDAITVYLYTDTKTAYERGVKRDGGNRHPGHLLNHYHKETYHKGDELLADRHFLTYEQFLDFIDGRDYNVSIGRTIAVDVTDFSKFSIEDIARFVTTTY